MSSWDVLIPQRYAAAPYVYSITLFTSLHLVSVLCLAGSLRGAGVRFGQRGIGEVSVESSACAGKVRTRSSGWIGERFAL